MYKNATNFSSPGPLSFCSIDGTTRNHSSSYYAVTFATSVIIAILSPVALGGNILIMETIWKNASLRTPSYILLCGLALTDLYTGLVKPPFTVAFQLLCLDSIEGVARQQAFKRYALAISAGAGSYTMHLTLLLIMLMSVERWLYMTHHRSLLTVRRSCFIVAVLSLLLLPVAVLRCVSILKIASSPYDVTKEISFILLLSCLIVTPITYFKVFRIIRRHRLRVQDNRPKKSTKRQNFGQPYINLAEYNKSVFSILSIIALLLLGYLPFLVFVLLSFLYSYSELNLVLKTAVMVSFFPSSLNPILYIWRMKDIRDGVRQLIKELYCCSH